ncbi:DUF2956 domain-containing protein [Vibrio sp. DW001]|uniref:DUF2956 domain-containing protein n=1 Tax=Vibrio sp. DW001 TaxID=2912315 RepID=UPI0023AFF7C0|nr:DUF2956 domain-containing protein [Vibrio sp. DW001]WED27415.1 DUF2956 domain-containing protein [Vibrio sp. DW001]
MTINKNQISPESQAEAMKIAKATQKPGQTKDQTKLIAQGIEKGIALYKKQQKEKNRQADRARKKHQKEKQTASNDQNDTQTAQIEPAPTKKSNQLAPWLLLLVSWIAFIAYLSLG